VDLCAGTGDLAVALARHKPRGRVVLVDFAEDMLRLAQRKLAADVMEVAAPLHPVCANALRLPLPDASCAALTAGFGVRNLQDTRAGLVEAHRVLRPGGRLAVLEFMRPQGLLAPLKRLTLRYVIPLVVYCVARRRAAAYRYLTESIVTYLTIDQMAALLREVGFTDIIVQHQPLGFASVIGGTRP
jgi:demethylmenaquinone methyltransferase/2-methoxy-6-polyprenyl-1,4-benzoquinol methylase